jgi:pimeloyl-ACP methyl ester carboxylesterase
VAVLGAGSLLLIVQGFDASFLDFQLLVLQLVLHHRVLVPDLCGFGFSPRSGTVEVSVAGMLRHLEALIDSAAFAAFLEADGASTLTRAFGVIGASMGAQVAFHLTRRRPERVNRLMLLSPSGLMEPVFHLPCPPIVDLAVVRLLSLWLTRYLLHCWMHARPSSSFGAMEREAMVAHLRVSGWGRSMHQFFQSGDFDDFDVLFPD